jgi:transcriptional regulator with XRE-family HTH domain
MIIDLVKMKSARDRRAMTQEALAHQARVNVRTIQRAENGEPIRHETLADIAAALGVPVAGLIKPEVSGELEAEPETDVSQTQVLKKVDGADGVIALLQRASMAVLDCTAEPNGTNMPVLTKIIGTLEGLIGSPWESGGLPLRFDSLLRKLGAIADLNTQLAEFERLGLALYSAAVTAYVKVPFYDQDEMGFVTTGRQTPQYVTAARLLIANYESDRLRVSADVVWPLDSEPEDDLPF